MRKPGKNAKQFLHYIFWCLMTTAVSWLSFGGAMKWMNLLQVQPLELASLLANILSWLCAVTFSFLANKWLVFRSRSWKLRVVVYELLTFYSTRLAVGLLEILLAPALVALGFDQPLFGVEALSSKAIVTPVVIALNYCFSRFLVFHRKKAEKQADAQSCNT